MPVSPAGPVNSVSPSPTRSSVETRTALRLDPEMRNPTPEVDGISSIGPGRNPLGDRALDVVGDHRTALSLVGVEQLRFGPALQHPAELPAEVVAVGDRRVHAGAAARGHPVRGVADQERAPRPETVLRSRRRTRTCGSGGSAAEGRARRRRSGSGASAPAPLSIHASVDPEDPAVAGSQGTKTLDLSGRMMGRGRIAVRRRDPRGEPRTRRDLCVDRARPTISIPSAPGGCCERRRHR